MPSEWATRVRHTVSFSAAILAFLLLAGATYQGVATALERRQFPHPGKQVDVGGHQLHLDCRGEGTPTVVLEAPAFGMSAAWGWIYPEVAEITRTCAYDRAGLGWSETGDAVFDPASVPSQLHALLRGSSERGPLVLVGQGVGAFFVRLFASQFPYDTAGLVLIDDPIAAGRTSSEPSSWVLNVSPWLARAGVLRASRLLSQNADGMPGDAGGAMRAFLNRPDHLTRSAHEVTVTNRVLERARAGSNVREFDGSRIGEDVAIWNVDDGRVSGLARLADQNEAAHLTEAIREAVRQVRLIAAPSVSSSRGQSAAP